MFRSSNHYKRKPEYVYGQDNNQQSKQNKLKLYKLTLAVGLPENINRDESPQLTEIKRQKLLLSKQNAGELICHRSKALGH